MHHHSCLKADGYHHFQAMRSSCLALILMCSVGHTNTEARIDDTERQSEAGMCSFDHDAVVDTWPDQAAIETPPDSLPLGNPEASQGAHSGEESVPTVVFRGANGLFLNATPQDGHVFLTWSPYRSNARVFYELYWRPVGEKLWCRSVVRGREHHAVTNLQNGIEYEFFVTVKGSRNGRSYLVRQTPRVRENCSSSHFFCTQQEADLWLQSKGLDPLTFKCRGKLLETWDLNSPNCHYVNDDFSESFLLLRSADSKFDPPSDHPSRDATSIAIKAIWPNVNPFDNPRMFPIETVNVIPANIGSVKGFSKAYSYEIKYHPMLSSRITWFIPDRDVKGYAIYHEGHGGSGVEIGKDTINWFLERGWIVVNVDMPLVGANAIDQSSELRDHNDFIKFDNGYQSPLGFFFIPVKSVIDMFYKDMVRLRTRKNIAMIGRSGGGWTATVYGALDRRIDVVVPVAGAVPISMRLAPGVPGDLGDYEQTAPHFYDVVAYEDLMKVTGSIASLFIYNAHDPCCFRVQSDSELIPYFKNISSQSKKNIAIWIDDENHEHSLSQKGLGILEYFLDFVLANN